MTPHIVGLDLSLSSTGWAVIRPGEKPRTGIITSPSVSNGSEDFYPLTLDRLRKLAARIIQAARAGRLENDPLLIAIEGPSFGNANMSGYHARAGLMWLVYHLLQKEADAIVIVPPASLKRYVTGNGNADKVAMVAAIQRAFPAHLVTDDNEADALGLAAMIARQIHQPQEASVQRVNPVALNAVPWPKWIRQL